MSCAEVLQASSQFFLENSTCPRTDSCAVRSLCDYRISELDQMLGHACIALACLGTIMYANGPFLAHYLLYEMLTVQQPWCLAVSGSVSQKSTLRGF